MSDETMNDEDIKQSLECCSTKQLSKCLECKITQNGCAEYLASQALALINRQQAEIEKLENAIIALMSYLDILGADKTDTSFIKQATEFNKQIRADIKAEAIKEFAERLKEGIGFRDLPVEIVVDHIDFLVKEMVGGENDTN